MSKSKDPYIIKSVIRCFSILEHIGGDVRGEATVGVMSRSFGITETAVAKILRTLETRSFVERESPAGSYRLGYGTLMLREAYLQHQRKQKMRDLRPFLERMALQTGETAYLAVPGKHGPVCEDVVESAQPVRVVCKRGTPFSLENTAVGKVMLAYSGASAKQRQEIEERGFVVSLGESDPEVTGVAVPVRDHAGAVAGAIGVAGPSFRFGLDKVVGEVAPVIVAAAREASHRLGFRGQPARRNFS